MLITDFMLVYSMRNVQKMLCFGWDIMQQTLSIINVLLHMAYEIFIDWSRGWETEIVCLWQSNLIGNTSLFHKGR